MSDCMKIALFTEYPGKDRKLKGGVPAVAVCLAEALSRLSLTDVHVITFDRTLRSVEVDKDGDVTVHRLPASNWPQVFDIQFGPGRKCLVDYLVRLAPDVLHLHETYGLTLGQLAIPHVFTIHGFDRENIKVNGGIMSWFRSLLWAAVERKAMPKHKHIISITPYVRARIERLASAKVYDIDNPIDRRFFRIARHEEVGRILFVGWICERKNTLAVLRALAKVRAAGLKATLVVAGQPTDKAYHQKVLDYIKKEDLGESVQCLGHISHEQLLCELSHASILVLPSRQENAPMAIAEAMAAGVPVIVSNRCGMPFMVQDGITGYLIEPDDIELLSKRIALLLSNDVLRNGMGVAGRREAEKRFHPDVVARKTLEVYQEVAASSMKGDVPKST